MSPLSDSRTQAAACTALAAAAILAWLLLATLKFDELSLPVPPRPVAEIVEQEEEFVDFLDMAYGPSDPAPAYTPEPQNHESKAAEASGIDKIDAGEPAPPAPDVVSERPSPIQRPKKETPPQTGPDLKKQAEEEARRKARKGVGDAFKTHRPHPTIPPMPVLAREIPASPTAAAPMPTAQATAPLAAAGRCRRMPLFPLKIPEASFSRPW